MCFKTSCVQAPAAVPARLAPPPTLAPRDPSKVAGKAINTPSSTNPFSSAPPSTVAPVLNQGVKSASNDPFGMSTFAAGGSLKVGQVIYLLDFFTNDSNTLNNNLFNICFERLLSNIRYTFHKVHA